MVSNTEAARTYLTERRERLRAEIATMQGRMNELDYLISELDTPIQPRQESTGISGPVKQTLLHPIHNLTPDPELQKRWNGKAQVYNVPMTHMALGVLRANPDKFMTTHHVHDALEKNGTPVKYKSLTATMSSLKLFGHAIFERQKGYRYKPVAQPDVTEH